MIIRKPANQTRRAAFTLMEMMVVVAIIVVLGGIAVLAYQNLGDKGNEAKAASTVKQIDDALYYYYLDHNTFPADVSDLTRPDRFGKTFLKAEALVPPWAGAKYEIDPNGPRNKALGQDSKPDVYIVHPSGRYMFGNWATGKQEVTR